MSAKRSAGLAIGLAVLTLLLVGCRESARRLVPQQQLDRPPRLHQRRMRHLPDQRGHGRAAPPDHRRQRWPAGLEPQRAADRLHLPGRRQLRDLPHRRRRQQQGAADQQPGQRRVAGVVARRPVDRLPLRPRRRLGHLRHARRRLRRAQDRRRAGAAGVVLREDGLAAIAQLLATKDGTGRLRP